MNQDGVSRRLAAILAADVVGYSRLMGTDETGTLARIKARAVLDAAGIGSDGSVGDITFSPLWQQYREPDANNHLIDGLRKAGLAE